ncbi:MAG: DeoR/GlpR family DNA-binding transcription regulator [Hyphomicrobiales bacterium]
MNKRISKSDARRARILDLLLGGQEVPIKDIADKLDVSLMTIHRDLVELEQNGAITRVRGAVSAEKSVLFESSYLFRSQKQIEEKKRLAKAALKFIEPGSALACDDSTTVYQIADLIQEITPVTVLTNGLPLVNRLCTEPGVEVIALGGKYHRGFSGFFGLQCEQVASRYIVDVAVMSSTTIQGNSLFTQDEQVVRMKRVMLGIAKKSVLLVDSSKFTYSALNHIADLSDFDHVIISRDTDADTLKSLRSAGIAFDLA